MIGRKLDQYTIVGEVGRGGMGEVYLAEDCRLARRVALKVLPASMASDPVRRSRFRHEARSVAALSHPNILAIHDFGEDGGVTYAVMELLEGETLRERLGGGALPWSKAVEIGTALAEGLAAAHARGIVHRDLKPENIFITRDGHVKILDFGLARAPDPGPGGDTDSPTRTAATQPGMAPGTAGYMAPEQARGERLDGRADLFALGCVLFEMIAGRPAFTGATSAERLAAILRDSPGELQGPAGAVPRELESVIHRCLEKDPAARFQTARDLAFTLRNLSTVTVDGSTDGRGAIAPEPARPRSLAVLPLRNLSGEPEQDFFADGLTEALIADLASLESVRVISRTSAMQYKGTNKRLREIASELGVDAIVEGSVLRGAGKVRITVELVQAATDTTLWASNYERGMDDILALQTEVSHAIAHEIAGKLEARVHDRFTKPRQVSPAAYEAYLKGRYYWNRRTEETLRRSLDHFNEAIAIEPAYALAHAGVADAYNILGFYSYMRPEDAFPRAKAAAERALEIDPRLADAHALMGYATLYYDWDWEGAESALRKTLEENPNSSEAHRYYANFLVVAGRFDEAIEMIRKACLLDPLSLINSAATGWVYYFKGDYQRSAYELKRTREFDRSFALGRLYQGLALLELEEHAEALEELRQASCYAGGVTLTEAFLAYGHARAGGDGEARRILGELLERSAGGHLPSYLPGIILAALGESEKAMERMEAALAERSHWLTFLNHDPRVAPLRSHPRFEALRRSVGLERLRA